MIHLVIGFKTRGKSEPVVLYCGLDGTAAQEAVYGRPPRGVIRTEWHRMLSPYKRHACVDPVGGAPIDSTAAGPGSARKPKATTA